MVTVLVVPTVAEIIGSERLGCIIKALPEKE